jgi:hypothetical protein
MNLLACVMAKNAVIVGKTRERVWQTMIGEIGLFVLLPIYKVI